MMPAALICAPKDVRLVAELAQLDFLHCAAVRIGGRVTALQAYCAMTAHIPAWLSTAFRLRDFVSRRFRVADIHGFTPRTAEREPAVGERLDFFTVEAIDAHRLVLTSRDTHLAVMVCLDLTPAGEGVLRLSVTTSVQRYNAFGRLYMIPVGPAHGPIVKRMLKNAVLAFPVEPY